MPRTGSSLAHGRLVPVVVAGVAVEGGEPVGAPLPGEVATAAAATIDERPMSAAPVEEGSHRPGQRIGVPGLDEDGAVGHHFGHRSGGGGDDRHPHRHGLERREPEALVDGRVGQQGGTGDGGVDGWAVHVTRPEDPARRRARRRRRRRAPSTPSPALRRSPGRPRGNQPPFGRRPRQGAGSPCAARWCRRPPRNGHTRRAVGGWSSGQLSLTPSRTGSAGRGRRGRRRRRLEGMPWWTARTRSGSAPKWRTTSSATNCEGVCTHAPSASARRTSFGKTRVAGSQSSG